LKKISREIKRVETEKLTAEENSPADAEVTWDMLRKNPKEKEGKVFTLELRADFVSQGECIIESRVAAAKVFAITCLYNKMDTQSFRNFESIKREDWFMIKGRFVGINSGGQVVIIADKCKNLGYR